MQLCCICIGSIYVSEGWLRTLGYDSRAQFDAERGPLHMAVHPEDRDMARSAYQDFLSRRSKEYRINARYFHRDGSVVYMHCWAVCLRDDQGKPILTVGMNLNRTAEHKALERAEQASQSKMRFLAMMSHEIRTPMVS